MRELMTKVAHDLGVACDGLKAAREKANAVECLVLMDVIWRTKSVLQDTKSLLKAIEADDKAAVKPKA